MGYIKITENRFSLIINQFCKCGGRGPTDNPCVACAIYHTIMDWAENLPQHTVQDGQAKSCEYCHAVDKGGDMCHQCGRKFTPAT